MARAWALRRASIAKQHPDWAPAQIERATREAMIVAEPRLIALFVRPLNECGISYLVTGGVASIVYGEPRFTRDIDPSSLFVRRTP